MPFEHKKKPLLESKFYFIRVVKYSTLAMFLLCFSVLIGVLGYHYYANLPWIDAFLNASMILTGMGPVDQMKTTNAKLFSSFYALYSGVAFLSASGVIIAPILHRLLHRMNIELED